MKTELVTRKEAADRLGVSVRTFDRWRKTNQVREIRDAATGYWVRFNWKDIEHYRRDES